MFVLFLTRKSLRGVSAPAPGTVIVQPRCGGGDTASYLAQGGAELGGKWQTSNLVGEDEVAGLSFHGVVLVSVDENISFVSCRRRD